MEAVKEKIRYKFDAKEHIHTLDGKPLMGTSTVVGVIAKPLTWWASGLAVQCFGWLNPKKFNAKQCKEALQEGYERVTKLSIEDYKKLLADAYKAHSVKLDSSASAGTDLHAELERFVKNSMQNRMPTPMYDEKIMPFVEWSKENVKRFLYSEAHCYDEETWTGGISDAGAEMNNGRTAIFDFKSSKEAYMNQAIQAGGYAIQIDQNGLFDSLGRFSKRLEKPIDEVYIVPFGAEKVEPVLFGDIEGLKQGFRAAVTLHKLINFN